VKRVQSDQRVICRPEEIRTDGETFVKDQMAPLTRRPQEEERSERNCQEPPTLKGTGLSATERPHGNVRRQTTR